MLYYDRSDLSERIDPAKVAVTKNVWFVTNGFLIMGLNIKIISVMVFMISRCCRVLILAIITVKGVVYHCIIDGISKLGAIRKLKQILA